MQLRAAVIQLNSRDRPAENLATVEHFLDRAAAMGAQFASLPEYWTYFGPYAGFDEAAQHIPGPAIERLQEKARKHKMIVHGGSIVERSAASPGKFHKELNGFKKGDLVLVKKRWVKQVNAIYAEGRLAFQRVKGEPANAKPADCHLLEREQTLVWEKVL